MSEEKIIQPPAFRRKAVVADVRAEKLQYIAEIFNILQSPSDYEERRFKYWYGDKFDELYERDCSELRMSVGILRSARSRK